MAKVLMWVEGLDGQVELLTDRVIVHRKGLWNAIKYGMNAKREIPLGAISEVGFKDATTFRFGEIEFVRGGRSGDESRSGSQTAVRFGKKQHAQFEHLKEKVFELMEQYSRK